MITEKVLVAESADSVLRSGQYESMRNVRSLQLCLRVYSIKRSVQHI
jgi:hypothetical protein